MLIKSNLKGFSIGLLVILSAWWAILSIYYREATQANLIWAATYQLMAIWGAYWGLVMGRHWGGLRSMMGRAMTFFGLGLLLQAFGQTVFSVYGLFLNLEIPYPSLADVGFFGSIPLYIIALIELGRASGVGYSMRSIKGKAWATLIPLAGLIGSYLIFLKGYEFDWTEPLKVVLDFGYPFGQAIYVSIAVLVYFLSRDFLGGLMKDKILLILVALVAQYVADFNFLYQFANGTWVNGGYGDYLYLLSYFLMAYSLIRLGLAVDKIRQTA
jgi:hypothetical protein